MEMSEKLQKEYYPHSVKTSKNEETIKVVYKKIKEDHELSEDELELRKHMQEATNTKKQVIING